MKKIAYMILALLVFAGCNEPNDPQPPVEEATLGEKIVGEWHCVISDLEADIYLSLGSDQNFELYQKVGDGRHRVYKGIWSADNASGILSGKYNDGSVWGSSYKVTLSEDGESMTLAAEKASDKEQVYQRCTIPAEVKDNSITVVKSDNADYPGVL